MIDNLFLIFNYFQFFLWSTPQPGYKYVCVPTIGVSQLLQIDCILHPGEVLAPSRSDEFSPIIPDCAE